MSSLYNSLSAILGFIYSSQIPTSPISINASPSIKTINGSPSPISMNASPISMNASPSPISINARQISKETPTPKPTLPTPLPTVSLSESVQTCRNIVLKQINESKGNRNFITSNSINYELIDSIMYSLDCQIKDIMNRLPITFVINDVTTIPSMSANINTFNTENINSPNPFSDDSKFSNLYQHLYNIDVNPGDFNRMNDVLGENSIPVKPPFLIVEHVSLPKVYLKFVFPSAESGDRGKKGSKGKKGPTGDLGPVGPTGVNGYNGNPPLYLQSSK